MLSARDQGYVITDNALFQLRSRHNLTREETARAESLRAGGFPTPSTSLLP